MFSAFRRTLQILRRRRLYLASVIALLVGFAAIEIADPFPVQALRFLAFDSFQKFAPRAFDETLPIRIVDVDDKSLAMLGQWPWPRTVMADLIGRIAADGASVVASDIIFAEPDRTSLDRIVAHLAPDKAADILKLAGGAADNDAVLAQTLGHVPAVLGTVLVNDESAVIAAPKAGFAIAGDDPRPFLAGFKGQIANLPALDAAAGGIGATNWVPDQDQIIRRVPLIFRIGDQLMPSLAAEALRVAQGASTYVLKASNASGETAFGQQTGLNHIRIGDVEAPVDPDGAIWLRFRHTDPRIYIPAWKIMAGVVPASDIAGRIMLVGTSAPGLQDIRSTPLDAAIPGVEIHAQLLESLLSDVRLTRPDYAPAVELVLVILLGLALSIAVPRLPASVSALLALAVVAAIFGASWYAFDTLGLLFDPVYPALTTLVMAATCSAWVYRETQIQRGAIRRAFGHYVSPTVVHQLIQHPERLILGGEQRPLTILFCDVRSFAAISETLDAPALTGFLNSLLTPLSEAILEKLGTIDKYMGDAIMAFWNAPLHDPAHARHACEAAIRMARAMPGLNAVWQVEADAAGRPFKPVAIGIGLNTGDCVVGNLGSRQRFDYSCIGDEVNVASRLESLTKTYGLTIALGEKTVAEIGDLPVLEIDLVRVKGKSSASRIYTLTDALGLADDQVPALADLHGRFLKQYRNRQWDAAEASLISIQEMASPALDRLCNLFAGRIAGFRREPPPNDWDGAYIAVEK